MKPNEAEFVAQLTVNKVTGTGTISACCIDLFSCIRNPKTRVMALTIMQGLHANMLARESRNIQERTE